MMSAFVDDSNFAAERKLLRDVFSPETRGQETFWIYHYDQRYYKVLSACAKLRLRTRNLPEGNPTYIEIRHNDWIQVFGEESTLKVRAAEKSASTVSEEQASEELVPVKFGAPQQEQADTADENDDLPEHAVPATEDTTEEPVSEEVEEDISIDETDDEPNIEEAVQALADSTPDSGAAVDDTDAEDSLTYIDAGVTDEPEIPAEAVEDDKAAAPDEKVIPVNETETATTVTPSTPAKSMPLKPYVMSPTTSDTTESLKQQQERTQNSTLQALHTREEALRSREDALRQREQAMRERENSLDLAEEELHVSELHISEKTAALEKRSNELDALKRRLDDEIEQLRTQKKHITALADHTGRVGEALLENLP